MNLNPQKWTPKEGAWIVFIVIVLAMILSAFLLPSCISPRPLDSLGPIISAPSLPAIPKPTGDKRRDDLAWQLATATKTRDESAIQVIQLTKALRDRDNELANEHLQDILLGLAGLCLLASIIFAVLTGPLTPRVYYCVGGMVLCMLIYQLVPWLGVLFTIACIVGGIIASVAVSIWAYHLLHGESLSLRDVTHDIIKTSGDLNPLEAQAKALERVAATKAKTIWQRLTGKK